MNQLLNVVTYYSKIYKLNLDHLIFKMLNDQKPKNSNHSLNFLYKNRRQQVSAGKCNCGGIHQISKDKVVWNFNLPENFVLELTQLKKR